MTLTDFYNDVAKLVDTDKTQIGVADTKRGLSPGQSDPGLPPWAKYGRPCRG